MIGKEVGAAISAPLRPMCRSEHFLSEPSPDMVAWYYGDSTTTSVYYEDLDDRTSLVTIVETSGNRCTSSSFTIGNNQKRQICQSYQFYHPITDATVHKGIRLHLEEGSINGIQD